MAISTVVFVFSVPTSMLLVEVVVLTVVVVVGYVLFIDAVPVRLRVVSKTRSAVHSKRSTYK